MYLLTASAFTPIARACYGMKWKMVWNGRRILVWNMEYAQNGLPYLPNSKLHILKLITNLKFNVMRTVSGLRLLRHKFYLLASSKSVVP